MGTGGGNAPMVAYGIDRYSQAVMEETAPTLKTPNGGDDIHCVAIENHPNDSRVDIDESGKVQTLTSRCGTGGGNVPLVMFSKVRRAKSKDDFETWSDTGVSNTLNNFDNGDVRTNECVVCYGRKK